MKRDIAELQQYYNNIIKDKDDININFLKFKQALDELISNAIISELKQKYINELVEIIDYTKNHTDEKLDAFLKHINTIITKSLELDNKQHKTIKQALDNMKKGI